MSFTSTRSTRLTIDFPIAFSLRGCPQRLSPGVYLVETDEQLIESLSFSAYQRIKTFIHLHDVEGRPGVGRMLEVSGNDMDAVISIGRGARERGLFALGANDGADLVDRDVK